MRLSEGIAVANVMLKLENSIDFPTTLSEIDGFGDLHIEHTLTATKDLQLKMKLENMPVAISSEMVGDYTG